MKWDWTTVIAVISLFLSIINTSKQIYDWMLKRREEKEKTRREKESMDCCFINKTTKFER